jgi:hypothetical protein
MTAVAQTKAAADSEPPGPALAEASANIGTSPSTTTSASTTSRLLRLAWVGLLVAALLPLVPVPIPTTYRPDVPRFFADGTYRQYLAPGQSLMAVPPTNFDAIDAMWWQAATHQDFAITGGYFIGPTDDIAGARAAREFTSSPRPTTQLLNDVAQGKPMPAITEAIRQQAHEDIRHWRVALVVLQPRYATTYQPVLEAILGPATPVGGVLVWDTRPILQ